MEHADNFGVKRFKDAIFRGEIDESNKRNGKGVIVYKNGGRVYEGDWYMDKRQGRGYEMFANGNIYQGEFF